MSIKNKKAAGLQDLQESLVTMEHVEKVHFSKNGNHYFNVHELFEDGKKTGRFFGHLDTKVILDPKSKDKKYIHVGVANNTEIVETLSADEVLNFKLKVEPGEKTPKKE
jgi:hypothetical protein